MSTYYSPVILERFTGRQVRRRRAHTRRLAEFSRQDVVPIDSPGKSLAIGGSFSSGEMAVFEDQAANDVLMDAEAQLRSGYPTIATSTIVHNKRQRHPSFHDDVSESQSDMKFLSELVKPIQYRWKFQKDKPKTIAPSKHGFHPRSKSPTFQRLVEATEKLQVMEEDVNDVDLSRRHTRDFTDTGTQMELAKRFQRLPGFRNAKTEPTNSKPESVTNSLPASVEPTFAPPLLVELKPEVRAFEAIKPEEDISSRQETIFPEDTASEDDSSPAESPMIKTVKEFKVDFKRTDSHSELHLFLPHIHDAMSRGTTPEYKPPKPITNSRSLPSIADTNDSKFEEKARTRVRRRNDKKKTRTRSQVRTKPKTDENKVFRDVLNDVPTLISMEKEQIDPSHPAAMCVFEHCPHHQHRKSTGLRQP